MILVTGGTGLLGMELISQLLSEGKKVRGIYHNNTFDLTQENFEKVPCDVLDVIGLEEAMEGIDELYHCAGLVSFAPGASSSLYKVNVEGTANIVNAALDAGIRKMIHVSSVAALGRNEQLPITEAMQWTEAAGNSKYGHSKYLGEMEVWRGIAEGLNAVIVNPSIILGAGDPSSGSSRIFQSVYNEFPWYSEGATGFVDARDVAGAMILLMDADVSAERFILNGANESYHELFNKIADAFGKKRPHKKATPFLAGLVWRLEAIRSAFSHKMPLVTKQTAANAMAKLSFDNSKLLKLLPSFAYRSLDITVSDTCSALQQKLNKH